MKLAVVSGIMLTLLFIGMLPLTFDVQRVESLEPPETEWTRTYGGHGAFSVVQTADGGYALAGYTWVPGAAHWDSWLVKVGSSGNVQWNRTYGGAHNEWAYSVVETSDGGYAFAGFTRSFGAGEADFWLVKVGSSGNVQWNRTYGGAYSDVARSVVETSDGGYALAGHTGSFDAGYYDFWLVKVGSSGNVQWNRTYGGAGNDVAWSVVETSDGGYALAGYGFANLAKTDVYGNLLWNKSYGGDMYSLVETSDGGFALAGSRSSDFWLVKVGSSGNVQWNKTYGGAGNDVAWSVVETSDGGYALAGETRSFGAGEADFWLVKVGSSGNMEWNRTYGGAYSDVARSVVETSDGGYALTGYTGSIEVGDYNPWLVKVACPSPVDESSSLALYIALASTITIAVGVTAVFVKHKKKQ